MKLGYIGHRATRTPLTFACELAPEDVPRDEQSVHTAVFVGWSDVTCPRCLATRKGDDQ